MSQDHFKMSQNISDFISDEQAQGIFRDMFSFCGTLTPDGRVISLSGEVFDRAGIKPDVLTGQLFSETVFWQSSEQTPGQLIDVINQAAKGEKAKSILEFRISSNERIIIELNVYPLFEANDHLEKLFLCANEVTTREREIEFYKSKSKNLLLAAENALIGLWFWDLRSNDFYTSPRCKEIFEVPAERAITFDDFLAALHPEDKQRADKDLREAQKYGAEYISEYRVVNSNGNIHWISARGKAFLDREGAPQKMMGIVQEITDKKLAIQELSNVYAHEKKLRDQAEEANRSKDFFLAVISHELRSPLNAILGWTKILLNRELDAETRKKALETVEKSARSQAKLLDDLLDSSRVASGRLKLEFRDINLFEIIKTVNNLQKPTAEAKNIDIDIKTDSENIRVFADSIRIQQVISNLLSNALKFTPDGGKITIAIKTEKDNVKIDVIDTGQGIGAKTLPNIFRQFRQGDEDSGDKGGLGLGLSIAKILVEKHRGKISAKSEGIGFGSTFSVTLPLFFSERRMPLPAPDVSPRSNRLLDGIAILIVEDEPDSREVLQIFLEQTGAKVKSSDSPADVLTYLRGPKTKLPDLILSDLAMPGMDGYTLLKEIRKLSPEQGGKIPAIALSAFSAADSKEKAFESGFQKYHMKPFEPDEIIEEILNLLKKS